MNLTQSIGDSKVHSIPLTWEGVAFEPGTDWGLIYTAKSKASDPDSAALIQKASGAGITVTGSTAAITLVPEDTVNLPAATLVTDIQAQHLTTGEVRTVALDRLKLIRDITRELTTSIPVVTTEPPIPWAGGGGDIAGDTHAATSKTTPADADEIPIVDSAAGNILKKLTWANLKTALASIFARTGAGNTFTGINTFSGSIYAADISAASLATSGTIAAGGTVTGSNLSGTNTGDQTSVTGNAGTVTTINGRIVAGANITITGAGTAASPYSIAGAAEGEGGGGTSVTGGVLTLLTASTIQEAASVGAVNAVSLEFDTSHVSGAPYAISSQTTSFGGPAGENDALLTIGFNTRYGSNKIVNTGGVSGGRKQFMMFEHDFYQEIGGVAGRLDEWHYDVEADNGTTDRLFHLNYSPATRASSASFTGNVQVFLTGEINSGVLSTGIFPDGVYLPKNGTISVLKQDGTTRIELLALDTSDRITPGASFDMLAFPVRLDSNLTNTSTRPATSASPIPGEVWAYEAGTPTGVVGLLRLSAGGGSSGGVTKSFIDISGFSTVSDMDRTITFFPGATKVLQLTATTAAVTGNLTVSGDMSGSGGIKTSGSATWLPATANSALVVTLSPSGTGTETGFTFFNNSSLGSGKYGQIKIAAGQLFLSSGANAGDSPDIVIQSGSVQTIRVTRNGGMVVGPNGSVVPEAGRFAIATPVTPASASAAGTVGTVAWDSSYIYVCVASNTWKRAAIGTW